MAEEYKEKIVPVPDHVVPKARDNACVREPHGADRWLSRGLAFTFLHACIAYNIAMLSLSCINWATGVAPERSRGAAVQGGVPRSPKAGACGECLHSRGVCLWAAVLAGVHDCRRCNVSVYGCKLACPGVSVLFARMVHV